MVLAMGSMRWTFGFETALKLSALMRLAAKDAKRFTGDTSHSYRVVGRLHDAGKGPDADQPFTPGKVYPVAREVISAPQIEVRQEQGVVCVRFKRDEAKLPYNAALTIAQWVRLRAKESKTRAGDKRHWSNVVIAA